MEGEIWKVVAGYENLYEVSDRGRVRSVRAGQYYHVLKVPSFFKGYARVTLTRVGGKVDYRRVHRLVAAAFVPKVEGKDEVNHKDGNRKNNVVENLEWATKTENVLDMRRRWYVKNGYDRCEYCSGKGYSAPRRDL